MRLLTVKSVYSSYRASPAPACPAPLVSSGLFSWCPEAPPPRWLSVSEGPPPRWLSVRTCWALCVVFFLPSLLVTLSGILSSLPARGHRCRLLDRKPEAAKPRKVNESQIQSWRISSLTAQVQSLPPKKKIVWDYYGLLVPN